MKFLRTRTLILLIIGTSIHAFGQKKDIRVKHIRNKDRSVDFFYEKDVPGSYMITVNFTRLENAFYNAKPILVQANSGKLFTLKPTYPDKGIPVGYRYSWIRGKLNPKIDRSFEYLLPFRKGATINAEELTNLGQQYFGSERPKDWKAYRFYESSSDTVLAIRKGIVVEIVNQFVLKSEVSYTSQKNRIVVEHEDGTYASYEGFAKEVALVKLGEKVYPHTPLGVLKSSESGNTGKLYLKVYFLIDAEYDRKAKETLATRKSRTQYIAPVFYTTEGNITIESYQGYTVDSNEKILTKELSRREKKRFKKRSK